MEFEFDCSKAKLSVIDWAGIDQHYSRWLYLPNNISKICRNESRTKEGFRATNLRILIFHWVIDLISTLEVLHWQQIRINGVEYFGNVLFQVRLNSLVIIWKNLYLKSNSLIWLWGWCVVQAVFWCLQHWFVWWWVLILHVFTNTIKERRTDAKL